jgi:diketogulonate reductase-like aldo/keto reductase
LGPIVTLIHEALHPYPDNLVIAPKGDFVRGGPEYSDISAVGNKYYLRPIAAQHNAKPQQITLAWQLHRTATTLPIAGTTSVEHLHDNLAAASISLTQDEVDAITALAPED